MIEGDFTGVGLTFLKKVSGKSENVLLNCIFVIIYLFDEFLVLKSLYNYNNPFYIYLGILIFWGESNGWICCRISEVY